MGSGPQKSLKAGYLAGGAGLLCSIDPKLQSVSTKILHPATGEKKRLGTAGVSSSTLDPGHIPATVE